MEQCINGMTCTEIQKDPNQLIYRKTQDLVRDGKWPSVMNNIISINCTGVIQRLNRMFKYHKSNLRMRPIVSCCLGPVYFIEKAFVHLLMSVFPHSIQSKFSGKFH